MADAKPYKKQVVIDCGKLKQDVATGIRRARDRTGLSQIGFCRLLAEAEPVEVRVSRGDLSKYEIGLNMPPADKYLKVLRVSEQFMAAGRVGCSRNC